MTRFAGDALNAIRRFDRGSNSDDRWLAEMLGKGLEGTTRNAAVAPVYTSEERRRMEAQASMRRAINENRIIDLNALHVIGDATLPESYADALNSYKDAVYSVATKLEQGGMPRLSALAAALRSVDVKSFTQGTPPQASYLQRYAEASRNPAVRPQMDIPENGEDEWGVLLSPREAIQAHERMSLNSRPGVIGGEDFIPF